MPDNVKDWEVLKNYLLGKASPAEEEEVERWLMSDDQAYDLLEAAEDELIDTFLRGKLRGRDLDRFNSHFLKAPERNRKLQFSRSLIRFIDGPLAQERTPSWVAQAVLQLRCFPYAVPLPKNSLAALLAVLVLILSVVGFQFLQPQPNRRSDQVVFTHFTSQPGPELFPSFSPDGKTIAYAGAAAGNWNIYIQRVGGHNPTNLTADSPADDTQPAFSPSGESIAFRSERDGGGIFIMGATGESVRRITDFGFNPAWSPDGKQLVFAEENVVDAEETVVDNPHRHRISSLWTVMIATGEKKKLFVGDAVQPQWSPNGDRIVYWAESGERRSIWTIRPDGTDPVPLTYAGFDWSPAWAANGEAIYFCSDRGGRSKIWRIPVNEHSGLSTGAAEAVTKGGTTQQMHPALSADGKVAFVDARVTENIFWVRFDPVAGRITGTPKAVTAGDRVVGEADLALDGGHIVFQSKARVPDLGPEGERIVLNGEKENLYVARVDGSGERQLTDDNFQNRVPRFSPDGMQVTFYSNRAGSYQIWSISTDGRGLNQISHDPAADVLRAVWSPEGTHLAERHGDGATFIVSLLKGEPVERLPPPPNPAEIFDVWSWSPDGNWLAGHRTSRTNGHKQGLVLYSLPTKTYQNLTESGTFPVWLQDSRKLLFVDDVGKIVLLDRESRKITDLLNVKPNVVSSLAQLSRDNKTIIYSVEQTEADLWMMQRFK